MTWHNTHNMLGISWSIQRALQAHRERGRQQLWAHWPLALWSPSKARWLRRLSWIGDTRRQKREQCGDLMKVVQSWRSLCLCLFELSSQRIKVPTCHLADTYVGLLILHWMIKHKLDYADAGNDDFLRLMVDSNVYMKLCSERIMIDYSDWHYVLPGFEIHHDVNCFWYYTLTMTITLSR